MTLLMLEFTECYLQVIVLFPSYPRFSVGHPCFLKNGFPPKDCGNDGLNTHTLCNIRVQSANFRTNYDDFFPWTEGAPGAAGMPIKGETYSAFEDAEGNRLALHSMKG